MISPHELGRTGLGKDIAFAPSSSGVHGSSACCACCVSLGDVTLGDATLGDVTLGDATLGDATLGDVTLGDAPYDMGEPDCSAADTGALASSAPHTGSGVVAAGMHSPVSSEASGDLNMSRFIGCSFTRLYPISCF